MTDEEWQAEAREKWKATVLDAAAKAVETGKVQRAKLTAGEGAGLATLIEADVVPNADGTVSVLVLKGENQA